MLKIEAGKKYIMKNGQIARVLATDVDESQLPLAVSVPNKFGQGCIIRRYAADGSFTCGYSGPFDLIQEYIEPEKFVCYVNVYSNGDYTVWSSRKLADIAKNPLKNRVARVRVETIEGQFDA